MDPNGPTNAITHATSSSISTYNLKKSGRNTTTSTSGTFPNFVSENYHKNKGSTHGDTMRNVAKQYKNTTFYK